jgi:hydroxymethylpyrimidine/phosphomethylpyrimidine kinase
MNVPIAMTIAGSDSCGGAGIEADIKTMSAFGVYAAVAITAVTAQNTLGVTDSVCLTPALVVAQIDAIMDDTGVHAAKTGMLGTEGIVRAVAEAVGRRSVPNLVVDPVMVATSGARLIDEDAVGACREVLLPLATVVTPNIPEAEILSGVRIACLEDMEKAAIRIHDTGPGHVLVKGGHMTGDATDVLYDGKEMRRFSDRRVPGGKVHGTGCTLSSAVASGLALGRDLPAAVADAKDYVTRCIECALRIGRGSALIGHSLSLCGEGEDA